jgi:predicted secreted acid phosphatase
MPTTALALRGATAAVLATATALTLTVAAPSGATDSDSALAPRTHFTMAPDGSSGLTQGGEGIPNIDIVKSTIRTYYHAPSGVADKTTSPYITEMKAIEAAQWAYLDRARKVAVRAHHKPAIVFDADDTTLWTYDMEDAAMHFNFDPALQDVWVQDERFPATPGMVDFVNRARKRGFAVFGITGRNDDQKAATLGNLRKVGYQPFKAKNFYTKWTGKGTSQQPAYVTCLAKCTTVEFKAGTRKHIESMGYKIVLNVGDQWSDLQGGYADRVVKLPNPTYFLPSTDLDGSPADAAFSPRSEFTMRADGSSGSTEGGEGIPNIDIVKSTIRTYYHASSGIANKDSSAYVDEMTALAQEKTDELVRTCASAKAAGDEPAIVFDADDTTLWTYDMEDGAMHFNFDPVVQDQQWVQPEAFPATPGMVDLVNAVGDAGCTVVGLTGRRVGQRAATLGNLAKVGYHYFTDAHYFTKWASGATPDPTVYAGTACENNTSCSTIQYKSAVRRYVESQGYDIVANVGDQFSDLIGGYADETVKLPNPTYYLP